MRSIDPIERLANAIILQAVKDYRKLWFIDDCRQKRELKRFFHSKWFKILTNIDGKWLLDELEEEERAERAKVNRRT